MRSAHGLNLGCAEVVGPFATIHVVLRPETTANNMEISDPNVHKSPDDSLMVFPDRPLPNLQALKLLGACISTLSLHRFHLSDA